MHGAAEEIALKHRVLRMLVEQKGIRSVAWEEDWMTGLRIDRYIRTGVGDARAVVGQMSPQWHSRGVVDVLRWMREYNSRHARKIRFVGIEYYFTGIPAYDYIDNYVARANPERLDEIPPTQAPPCATWMGSATSLAGGP